MKSGVFAFAVTIINLLLWLILFIKFKKHFSAQSILEDIRSEIDKLLTEVNRETDRDLTLLDEKMAEVKKLIELANKRINLAVAEENKKSASEKITLELNAGRKKAGPEKSFAMPVTSAIEKKPETEKKPEAEKPVSIKANNASSKKAVEQYFNFSGEDEKRPEISVSFSENPVQVEKTLKQKVLELWNQGITADVIAEKLSASVTEVQMIVDMYGI